MILIILLLPLVLSQECQSWRPQGSRAWMSTKTGYTQIVKNLGKVEEISVSGCEARHLWTVVRHGTRYPSVKAIKLMTEELPELRERIVRAGKLCPQDLRLLQDWRVELEPSQEKVLHREGEREMVLLGSRWSQRLPALLAGPGLYMLPHLAALLYIPLDKN